MTQGTVVALRSPGMTAGIPGISRTHKMPGVTWIPGNNPWDEPWDLEDIRDPWEIGSLVSQIQGRNLRDARDPTTFHQSPKKPEESLVYIESTYYVSN